MSARFDNLFGAYPSFTCEEIGDKANDFSNNITAPITFTQMNFWIFFAGVYFVYCLIYNRFLLRSAFLLLVSLFFYFKTSGLFVSILIFSTIFDFFVGKALHKAEKRPWRLFWLILSMFVNMFVLCYFKYAYFFADSYYELTREWLVPINYFAEWNNSFFDGEVMCASKIILPVGISFFTFQTMSYCIDIYRKELKPVNNIIDFGFFVTFFPQLVAGPIVRAKDFIPQIHQPFHLTQRDFGWSIWMILKGLTKKIVVADFIALNFVDRVFEAPEVYPGFVALVALWGYSMIIYGDFSGYTDIAIGVSKLMGFHLNENFNSPYKALNVADFWRRWHISLSSWLKDYLYIPLGGNKKATFISYIFIPLIAAFIAGVANYYWGINFWMFCGIFVGLTLIGLIFPVYRKFVTTDINLLITMLLGGLWHGAEMKFIIWGGLNGLALVIYKYWKRISPYEKSNFFLVHFWKIFITFNFIAFTRVFFRARSMDNANHILDRIFYHFDFDWAVFTEKLIGGYPIVMLVILISYMIHWLPTRTKENTMEIFIVSPLWVKALLVFTGSLFIYQFYSAFAPFVYFAF